MALFTLSTAFADVHELQALFGKAHESGRKAGKKRAKAELRLSETFRKTMIPLFHAFCGVAHESARGAINAFSRFFEKSGQKRTKAWGKA